MSRAVSALERERIREADAIVQEKAKRDYVPPPVRYHEKISFVISRCIDGPQGWVGFFRVESVQKVDGKKPVRKIVADGVDIGIAMSNLETALRQRVFK